MPYFTADSIAHLIDDYEHTRHRCQFCNGIKNDFAKEFYGKLRRLDVAPFVIQELKTQECKCYKIEYN